MYVIVLREMLSPAEQGFMQLVGRLNESKLWEIGCESIRVTDGPFVDATIRNVQGIATELRVPISLVLLVLMRPDQKTPAGFVGPLAGPLQMTPRTPSPAPTPQEFAHEDESTPKTPSPPQSSPEPGAAGG